MCGERFADCARREVLEETGLILAPVAPGPYRNDVFVAEGKHYVTLFVLAHCAQGEPALREPHTCAGWHRFAWDALPVPLFAPLAWLRRTGCAR